MYPRTRKTESGVVLLCLTAQQARLLAEALFHYDGWRGDRSSTTAEEGVMDAIRDQLIEATA